MPRKVSSHDVARQAGVSQSTVSLVLNGRTNARIPETTRQRVLEAAQSLNYTRDASARALVTGRTNRLGIVPNHPYSFRNRQDHYYGDILAGVMEGTILHNFNLLFHSALYANARELAGDILSGGADGVLLVGRTEDDELTTALQQASFPTVCISCHPAQESFYAVDCDNEAGGQLAVAHLLALGHRHIAYFHTGERSSWERERRQGVETAMRTADLPNTTLNFSNAPYQGNFYESEGKVLADWLRAQFPVPTALFFGEETAAQYAAEHLPAFGIRVPDDVSIISFNSTDASVRTRPPLTSIYQPLLDIGTAAAEMLAALVNGEDIKPGVQRFPVRLDVRASTAPPPTTSLCRSLP